MSPRRRRRRSVVLPLVAILGGASGCARLPAVVAPVEPAPHSALEMERRILEEGRGRVSFRPDATLLDLSGDTVSGRQEILDLLHTSDGDTGTAVTWEIQEVYRCGAALGVERSVYRSPPGAVGALGWVGRWHAVWETGPAGEWTIREARLLAPGASYPATSADCVETREEVRGGARFSASVHLWPFVYHSVDPNDEPNGGRVVERERARSLMIGPRWRLGNGLAAGGYLGLEKLQSLYTGGRQGLKSSARFAALVVAYEGRNVSLDAGPAWVRTAWTWLGTDDPDASTHADGLGAVITARITIDGTADAALDLVAQQRFFPDVAVPRTTDGITGGWGGLFLGLGLTVRRSK